MFFFHFSSNFFISFLILVFWEGPSYTFHIIFFFSFARMESYTLATAILAAMLISVLACPPGCEDTGDTCGPDRPPPPMLNDDQQQQIRNDMQR